jgi:hypothetical protein
LASGLGVPRRRSCHVARHSLSSLEEQREAKLRNRVARSGGAAIPRRRERILAEGVELEGDGGLRAAVA